MLVCSRWEAAELLLLDQLTGYSARTVNSALSSGNTTMSQAGFRVTLQNHPYRSSAEVKLAELTRRADAAQEKWGRVWELALTLPEPTPLSEGPRSPSNLRHKTNCLLRRTIRYSETYLIERGARAKRNRSANGFP